MITKVKTLALVLLCALPVAAGAQSPSVVVGDRARITERAVIGGSTFGDVLRVVGASTVSSGTGTMNPWVLDSDGDALRDAVTTVSTGNVWTFGVDHLRAGAGSGTAIIRLNGSSGSDKGLIWQDGGSFAGQLLTVGGNQYLDGPGAFNIRTSVFATRATISDVGRIDAYAGVVGRGSGASISKAALGFDNVRFGVADGTARAIFEDTAGSLQWTIDNSANALRFYRSDSAGTHVDSFVGSAYGDVFQLAPKSREILPATPFGFSLGNPFFQLLSIWAAELNVTQLVSREHIATTGGRFTVGRSTTLLEGVTSSDTAFKVKHNDSRPGDIWFIQNQMKFEAASVGTATPINRCDDNCDADNGSTAFWGADSNTLTWQRAIRWHGEGAISHPGGSSGADNLYHVSPGDFVDSTQYTCSVFIRRGDGGVVTPGTGSSGAYRMLIDGTGVDANVVDMGNAWYRLYATRTVGVGGNDSCGILNLPNLTHYVDAMQIEQGATLSDYSKFSTQYNVTRNLDGSSANPWDAGSGIFNTGSIGSGWIDQYADQSIRGMSSFGSWAMTFRPAAYIRFCPAGSGNGPYFDASINAAHMTQTIVTNNGGCGLGAISDGGNGWSQGPGGASYLTTANQAALQLNLDVSVSLFYILGIDTSNTVVAKGPGGLGGDGEFLVSYVATDDKLHFSFGNGTTTLHDLTPCGSTTVTLASYDHWVFVRDATLKEVTCYRNGVRQGSSTYSTNASTTTGALSIGASTNGTNALPSGGTGAAIDEVLITPTKLTGADVAALYDSRTKTLPETQYGPTIAGLRRFGGGWSDYSTVWVIGQLLGHCNNYASAFGAIFGPCDGAHLQMDNVNGVRGLYGTTEKFGLKLTGAAFFTEGAVTIDDGGIRIFNSGSESVSKAYTMHGNVALEKRAGLFYIESGGNASMFLSIDQGGASGGIGWSTTHGGGAAVSTWNNMGQQISMTTSSINIGTNDLRINSTQAITTTVVVPCGTLSFTEGILTSKGAC